MNIRVITRSLNLLVACACVASLTDAHVEEQIPRPVIERLAYLPIDVAGGALLSLPNNRLMYAGGTTWSDGKKQWLKDVFIYDVATDRWTAGPPLPNSFDASLPLQLQTGWRIVESELATDAELTLPQISSNRWNRWRRNGGRRRGRQP
jgi:hypothetical protein